MTSTILKKGTIVKTDNGNDFELQVDIDIFDKQDILNFIGVTPSKEIQVKGIDQSGANIDTTLDAYECIEDLLQCIEFNPPRELYLLIGEKKYELMGI